MTGSFDI